MNPSIIPSSIKTSVLVGSSEKQKLLNRKGWDTFVASAPLPALWVSAHVDLSGSKSKYAALDQLKMDLSASKTTDSIACSYRSFLQKVITQLNRKILRSRNSLRTFRFLGSLERNAADIHGRDLHYHFFLWAPDSLLLRDPVSGQSTVSTLKTLWHQKVNNKITTRFKPIDIQIIGSSADAMRVSQYTNKANWHFESYELFDDWSTSI